MNEMQDYFADLLNECVAEKAEKTLVPEPRAEREKAKPFVETQESTQQQDALAALQKRKLQALLDQQKVLTETKTGIKTQALTALKNNTQTKTETKVETKAQTELANDTELSVPDLLQWQDNGRPIWAQEAFDVLLFSVNGLTLAVPLIALGQIQKIENNLTPLFGQSDWFMGLMKSPQGNIKTVNTALFVMPERYNPRFLETARFVISIDGLKWGLAVDSVNQPSRIHPDDVNWRGNRSKRPWLAGTVKAAMCALIDIPQMGKILSESEK